MSFLLDLDDFSLRLRVVAAPSVPIVRRPNKGEVSGTGVPTITNRLGED